MEGLAVKLQSTSLDIIQDFRLVEEVKVMYKDLSETAGRDFPKIYDHSVRVLRRQKYNRLNLARQGG